MNGQLALCGDVLISSALIMDRQRVVQRNNNNAGDWQEGREKMQNVLVRCDEKANNDHRRNNNVEGSEKSFTGLIGGYSSGLIETCSNNKTSCKIRPIIHFVSALLPVEASVLEVAIIRSAKITFDLFPLIKYV